jgi:IPT/TIG domain
MSEAAGTAALAAVTPGWKWLAVLIGLAVLAVPGVAVAIPTGGKPWRLVNGADGRPSTSKFQWLLWLVVILFAYTVLWALRARQGNYSAITQVPVNLLTVLGFSTGTAAAAKGITAGYVQSNRVAKPKAVPAGKNTPAGSQQGGLVQDDTGVPELAKLQMMGFTLIAVGIFLVTLIHQIVSNPVITSLPNIDSSLLVLMGISQGGYLGKKLVSFGAPALYPPNPAEVDAGSTLTLTGANLGKPPAGLTTPPGGLLTLDNVPVSTGGWTDNSITFTAPGAAPPSGATSTQRQQVKAAVIVNGQSSNSVTLTIISAPLPPPSAPPDPAGPAVTAVAAGRPGPAPGE